VGLLSPAAPASATTSVSALRAQASALTKQMIFEQLQVGGYTQQYNEAVAKAQADESELSHLSTQITTTESNIVRDRKALRHEVVRSYMDSGANNHQASLFFSNTEVVSTKTFYQEVMTGNLSDTLSQLRIDRVTLREAHTSLVSVTAAAQQEEQVAASMLSAAQSTENQLAAQSASINASLAAAINALWAQEGAAITLHLGVTGQPVLNSFLDCVIMAESGGDYRDVSRTGQYMGAFQFLQSTWNEAALLAGLPTLVGVPPNQATPEQQDTLAVALYNYDGEQPWYDPCRH
jgi:hypothetical protein